MTNEDYKKLHYFVLKYGGTLKFHNHMKTRARWNKGGKHG